MSTPTVAEIESWIPAERRAELGESAFLLAQILDQFQNGRITLQEARARTADLQPLLNQLKGDGDSAGRPLLSFADAKLRDVSIGNVAGRDVVQFFIKIVASEMTDTDKAREQLRQRASLRDLFDWLTEQPFLQDRGTFWAYHPLIRAQILRQVYRESPRTWSSLQGELAEFFEGICESQQLNESAQWRNPVWQDNALEAIYHRLCQNPEKYFPDALNGFMQALATGSSAALAVQLSFARRWAEAIEEAGSSGVQLNAPANANVREWGNRLLSGLKAYEERRHDDAISMFTDLLNHPLLEPRWLAAVLGWRGYLYCFVNRYAEALEDTSRALELAPSAESYVDRGTVHFVLGNYKEALADFGKAAELDPRFDRAYYGLGLVYRTLGEAPRALEAFSRAIELYPEYALAFAERGDIYRSLGDTDKAVADLTQALVLNPRYSWAFAVRGAVYEQSGDPEAAIRDFTSAIDLVPGYAWAFAKRGAAYQLLGNQVQAIQDFSQAIALDLNEPWVLAGRGDALRANGELERAFQDYSLAAASDPGYAWAFASRGLVHKALSRYEAAIADFDAALGIDKDLDWVLAERGDALRAIGRFQEALDDLNTAIRTNPDFAWALARRGDVQCALGDLDSALADYERAIELDPQSAIEYDHYAAICARAKQFQKAKAAKRKRMELAAKEQ